MPYVQVTIAEGRSADEKRALMTAVAHAVNESIGAPLETVHVWVSEVAPAELSIGGIALDELRARTAQAMAP
jgi:4-oxalocrotonate tautomerase